MLDHLTEFALLGSPLAAPAVSAAKVSNGIELTWLQVGSNVTGYEVYRSASPYFAPGAGNKLGSASASGAGNPASYTDETLTDPLAAYFYIVRGVGDGDAVSPASNRVGVFRFGLTPGAQ